MSKVLVFPFNPYYVKHPIYKILQGVGTCVVFQSFQTLDDMPHPARFCILPAYKTGYQFEPIFIEPTYNEAIKDYDPHSIGLKFNPFFEKMAIQALPAEGVVRDEENWSMPKIGFKLLLTNIGNDDDDDSIKPIPTFPRNALKREKTLLEKTTLSKLSF